MGGYAGKWIPTPGTQESEPEKKRPGRRPRFRVDPKQLRSQDHNIPSEGGRPRPALLHSPPSSPSHARLSPAPLRSAAVRPPLSGLRPPRLQSGPRLRGTKKSWRVVCARAARGSGAAVFSVPGAQNIDLITPRKRGHNIFGCISKLN